MLAAMKYFSENTLAEPSEPPAAQNALQRSES